MKKLVCICTVGVLLLAGSSMAARVSNIDLGHQDGSAVVKISIDGQVRYTHATEVPKNGRPDRIIVDILSATHDLGAKEFLDLPKCIVAGIRTSQYAVNPERVVRIVLDLNAAPIYRVDSDETSITINVRDQAGEPFAAWSSAKVVAASHEGTAPTVARTPARTSSAPPARAKAPSVAQQNAAIEKDRQQSLVSQPSTPKAKKAPAQKPVVAATDPPAPKEKSSDTPDWFLASQSNSTRSVAPVPKQPVTPPALSPRKAASQPMVAQAQPEPAQKAKAVQKKSATAPVVAQTPKATTPAPVQKARPAAPKPAPQVVQAKPAAKKSPAQPKAKAGGQQALAQKVSGSQAVAVKPAPQKDQKTAVAAAPPKQQPTRATSRFRRSAASAKIKGTMVAEFPKRLVIKYKSSGRRDPFRTLLDDSRTYDDPVERRVPNVEGLRLVGIIESAAAANRALFEDKAGYSYILKSGDKVRNGYVLRVEADRVYFQIFEYGWSRTVALKMDE